MFGIKKKQSVNYKDLIWMSSVTKTMKLLSLSDDGKPVIIVSSFAQTLNNLQNMKPSLQKVETLSGMNFGKEPLLLNSKLFLESNMHQKAYTGEVHIAFTEHYPLPDKDREILLKTASVFNNPIINFYISLEDPLLKMFNSETIISMMKAMGMNENEVIEHRMISKSIVNAQKKLAKKIRYEQKYDDEEQWYRMNYRE